MSNKGQSAQSIWDRAKGILVNNVAQGIIGTMLLKVASAVIAFALFSFATNAAGAEEFGTFSIFFSIASLLSIVAAGGQELQIVRSWSEYLAQGRKDKALGALHYGWIVSLSGVVIVSILVTGFLLYDAEWNPLHIDGNYWLIAATIAFLATNTLSLYSSHAARAIVGIKLGDAHYELTWRGIAIAFLAVCLILGYEVKTEEILGVFALGLLVVIATQVYFVRRNVQDVVGEAKPAYDNREWAPRSARLWLASIMEAANQHLEVLLIGVLLDPVAAGAYFVASRLSNAFALAAGGIITFGTRRVPSLYFGRKIAELKHTLNLMATMSLIIVVGGLGMVLVAGDYLLLIFGRAYVEYYDVFLILSVGTALTAANGPAPSFLMLTGHEGLYMKLVTTALLYRVAGFLLAVPAFGIVGAAGVTAFLMVVMAVILNVMSRRLTGMDSSILRLIHESPDVPPAKPGQKQEKSRQKAASAYARARSHSDRPSQMEPNGQKLGKSV